MAFTTKYRMEFKDMLELLWRVDIEVDGWGGSITTLDPTGSPLAIKTLNGGDDWYTNPIHGSTATLEVYDSSGFQFLELYDYANLTYRVSIYQGDSYTLYWRGFINSEGYSEDYDGTTYAVSLEASDGLGLLKTKPFKYTVTDEDDTYYNGRLTEAYIISQILGKVNITSFSEFINVYESTMANGTGDSPLIQTSLDVDVFKDMSCYDVLSKILNKYGAVIVQDRGVIYIVRPEEMFQGTVYGRSFTSATAYSSTSITPEQWVDRADTPTNMIVTNGGTLSVNPPVKKVTINQDYGYKKSWIDNPKFSTDSFNKTTSVFSNWVNTNVTPVSINSIIKNETDGIFITPEDFPEYVPDQATFIANYVTKYVSQSFGSLSLKTALTNEFELSFSYCAYNNNDNNVTYTEDFDLYISIRDSNGTYYLKEKNDTFCEWVTPLPAWTYSLADITGGPYIRVGITDNLAAKTLNWKTWSRSIPGLPVGGTYEIRIFKGIQNLGTSGDAINPSDLYIGFKDINFIATSDKVKVTTKRKSRWIFPYGLVVGALSGTAMGTTGLEPMYSYNPFGKRKIIGRGYQEILDNDEVTENTYTVTNNIKGIEIDNDYTIGDITETDTEITNILEQFQGALSIQSLPNAAAKWVTDNAPTYLSGGVVTTNSGKVITLESSVAGTDFSGFTTITNLTGDLSGTVATVVPNSGEVLQIAEFTFSGTSGSGNVRILDPTNGLTYRTITFSSSISTSINNFISSYSSDFLAVGYTISHPTTNVLRVVSGNHYSFTPSYAQVTSNLTASVATTQAYQAAQKRKDTITLSGSYGTANILCDGTTKVCSVITTKSTGVWNTRQYANEAKPLLQVLGDSIKKQYNRATQLLDVPVIEKNCSTNVPQLRLAYNLRDSFNIDGLTGDPRYYFINGAEFNVRDREWDLNLVEIVTTV